MEYLRIRKWSEFQQCDKNAPWVKLYTSALSNFDFMTLDDNERLAFLLLLLWTGIHGNKIPKDTKTFTAIFLLSNPLSFDKLIDKRLLEQWDEQKHNEYYQSVTQKIEQERKNARERQQKRRDKESVTGSSQQRHGVMKNMSRDVTLSETETETETETDNTNAHFSKKNSPNDTLILSNATKNANGLVKLHKKKFIEFWSKYPKKVNKTPALKAFLKSCKKIKPDEIIGGIDTSPQLQREIEFVPYASTWLNQEGWNDEPQKQQRRKMSWE